MGRYGSGFEGGLSITRGILGPPPPLKCPELSIVPPQNHFVPPHINNRYIDYFMYQPMPMPMCIAPMVWAFLSTTVQLHATHRKVEGGERDTQLVHVYEAISCLARGYCVSQAAQGERHLSSPPPLSYSTPPPPQWLKYVIFSVLGQKRGRPLVRGSKVMQLNSDSFCDYVRIWTEVIGHLWAELGFWFFPEKRWKYSRPRTFDRARIFWQVVPVQQTGTVRQRRRPYKLGGLRADPHLRTAWRRGNITERELFSQTEKESEVGDSAEPK